MLPKYFYNKEQASITIVAPYDGWCEVSLSFLGWGYDGNLWTWTPCPYGETDLKEAGSIVGSAHQGRNNEYVAMTGKTYFENMIKNKSYTFVRKDIQGSPGAIANQRFNIVCYPI